ncbi:histone-like nucleoid-structuring protein Lsr2 [Aeromicrobium sp. Sec7.5]|uniref:histone-like nucleoid-structuring protein Lsr2 n=1 Tax=Aeromicrobium sp. Sec7.5 TaxID=3121276 RepID=UPI002FE45B35
MAKRTIAKYFSDLSGNDIESSSPTVHFAFDGASYEIDLTETEADELREALAPYVAVARRASGTRAARKASSASGGPSPKDVRAWAVAQGLDVPTRGRIPASLTEAYESQH